METRKTKSAQRSNSFGTLIFYTLSIIVVSLTVFNFYLLNQLWSSLNGSGSSAFRSSQWAKLDMLSEWSWLNFPGRLLAKHSLEVDEVRSLAGYYKSGQEAKGLEQMIGDSELRVNCLSCAIELAVANQSLLEISSNSAKRRRIKFPFGVSVKSALKNSSTSFSCLSAKRVGQKSACQIKSAKLVRLSSSFGIDADRKSVQSSRINTKRVHSATMELDLFGASASSFEANKRLELKSLERLHLSSRNSSVILDAETIDISQIKQQESKRAGKYKLCICLANKNQQARHRFEFAQKNNRAKNWPPLNENPKLGLVFGVGPELNCNKFTTFCRLPQLN